MVKIPLKVSDAFANQHTHDDFNKLLDGNINTQFVVWNPLVLPYKITFDFLDFSQCNASEIRFRFNTGNPYNISFYGERRSDKQVVLLYNINRSFGPNEWGVWQSASIATVDISKIIIQSNGNDQFPFDFELWGDYTVNTSVVNIQRSPLSKLAGVVVKPWDVDFTAYPEKRDALKSLSIKRVRLYNDYELNHNPDGSWNANEFKQVDSMRALKAEGIEVQMCYLSLPTAYPWPPTANRQSPATYQKLADDVRTLCTGAEYIDVFELLNEQNAWYHPDTSFYFDGYELAAMCSMCFDGHKGQFNTGLKASGSAAQFSIGGVAEAEPYLLYQIMEWSIANRGLRPDGTPNLPFDIYSFHCYSSLGGQYEFSNPGGVSPEYGMAPYFKQLNKVRKKYFPWLKFHVGEHSGGDVSQSSPLSATAFGSYSGNQVSAMWTARDLLAQAEHEINASSYYRIQQDYNSSDNSDVQFNTMALWRVWNEGGIKQPDGSYLGFDIRRTLTGDYFKQLVELVFNTGYVFDTRLSDSPNVVRFKKDTSFIYVIWETENMIIDLSVYGQRPQFTERTGNYTLNATGTLRKFVDTGDGVMSSQSFNGGSVAYGSKPVFVVVDGTTSPTPTNFDLIAETAAVVIARQTISFTNAGLDATNTRVVYEVGSRMRSWKPERPINSITQFEAGKAYYIIPKQTINKTQLLAPPFNLPPLL